LVVFTYGGFEILPRDVFGRELFMRVISNDATIRELFLSKINYDEFEKLNVRARSSVKNERV